MVIYSQLVDLQSKYLSLQTSPWIYVHQGYDEYPHSGYIKICLDSRKPIVALHQKERKKAFSETCHLFLITLLQNLLKQNTHTHTQITISINSIFISGTRLTSIRQFELKQNKYKADWLLVRSKVRIYGVVVSLL